MPDRVLMNWQVKRGEEGCLCESNVHLFVIDFMVCIIGTHRTLYISHCTYQA